MEKSNKELLDEKYQEWYHELAKRIKISPRVLKHVRCLYKTEFADVPYMDAVLKMRRIREKKLTAQLTTHRQMKLNFIHAVSREVGGLSVVSELTGFIETNVKYIIGFIDKIGYSRSIIRFLKRVDEEQMKELIETEIKLDEKDSN